MRNWLDAGKIWRCSHCLDLLDYLELRQDSVTGDVFCQECWFGIPELAHPAVPTLVCDECGIPMRSTILESNPSGWHGTGFVAQLCEGCQEPLTDEELEEYVASLVQLLEDTDEDG